MQCPGWALPDSQGDHVCTGMQEEYDNHTVITTDTRVFHCFVISLLLQT